MGYFPCKTIPETPTKKTRTQTKGGPPMRPLSRYYIYKLYFTVYLVLKALVSLYVKINYSFHFKSFYRHVMCVRQLKEFKSKCLEKDQFFNKVLSLTIRVC